MTQMWEDLLPAQRWSGRRGRFSSPAGMKCLIDAGGRPLPGLGILSHAAKQPLGTDISKAGVVFLMRRSSLIPSNSVVRAQTCKACYRVCNLRWRSWIHVSSRKVLIGLASFFCDLPLRSRSLDLTPALQAKSYHHWDRVNLSFLLPPWLIVL